VARAAQGGHRHGGQSGAQHPLAGREGLGQFLR
jgi:hypothetical protein